MSNLKNFVTCHSHPRSLDSASVPEAFVKRELELGSGAVTCTDHGTLAASREIYDLAKANNIIPIIGLEAYFRDDNCPILLSSGIERTHTPARGSNKDEWKARYPEGTFIDYGKYYHVTLGFLDQKAFEVGVRLLSKAEERAERHGQERKPLFDWAALEELGTHNVTATSSCLIGVTQRHLMERDRPDIAEKYFLHMKELFKNGFYTEVFPHVCDRNWVQGVFITFADGEKIKYNKTKNLRTNVGDIYAEDLSKAFGRKGDKHKQLLSVKDYHTWHDLDTPRDILKVELVEDFVQNECTPWAPDGDVQIGCNKFVLELAEKHGTPVLVGDDSHFATPNEKIVQDVRLCQGGSWRFYGSYHRQSSDEAFDYFKNKMGIEQKTFEKWIDNSHEWADRFKGFHFDSQPSLPTKFYPSNTYQHTLDIIKKHGRMDWNNPVYVQRLHAEVKLLYKNDTMDFLPYFFVIEDVVSFYNKNRKITGPGRGSAAGLLLTYITGITHVDPIKYELSMDRFLTPTRIESGKFRDIDQDLPSRDILVEDTVVEKYHLRLDDGRAIVVGLNEMVETSEGPLLAAEAFVRGLDITIPNA